MRDRRRHQYWRAGLVGLGAGAVALLFQSALESAEWWRGRLLEHVYDYGPWGWLILPAVAGCIGTLVGWITSKFAPSAAGSGIPHVKGVLMHVNALSWTRVLPVKFFGGILCTGVGFSLGREGPTVQMGAAVGKLISEVLRVPPKATPRLMACGAGAGLAAAFHAPLAGFIFTIEELQREFSSLTYTMALIAAVVADIVATSFWGSENVFHATGFPAASLTTLPICVVIGALGGVFGMVFNRLLLSGQQLCRQQVTLSPTARAGCIGVLVGVAITVFPEVAGGGQHTVTKILNGDTSLPTSVQFLLVLFLGKLMLTVLSYLSGVPGGIFSPMLVMGASLGLLSGIVAHDTIPLFAPVPASFAAIGMAAFFTAVVRAPLTGIVLVLEMTDDYHQLLPLIIGAMVAYVVSERLGVEPIYDALLALDLHRARPDVPAHREPVLLEFVIEEESELDGKRLRDIPLPERCLFVTITRHGSDVLPDGETVLRRGDHVTAVLSGADASESVNKVLSLSKV